MDPGQYNLDIRAAALLSLIDDGRPMVGVEVGVYRGDLSAALLHARPQLCMLLVDSWGDPDRGSPYYQTGDHHASMTTAEQEAARQLCMSNIERFGYRAVTRHMKSAEAALRLSDRSVDFVFLDADHSFEGVTEDLNLWLPKIKDGGWIGGHDYANPALPDTKVKEAVDAFFGEPPRLLDDMVWVMPAPFFAAK